MSAARARHVLIAGAPHFVATLLCDLIAANEPASKVTVLAPPDHVDPVRDRLPYARLEVVPAQLTREGFGLSRPKLRELKTSVTDVYNFVSIYHLGVDKRRAEDLNIHGARLVLGFARSAPNLVRFNHYSTAFVAGDRTGIVLETELERGQEFRNTYERTKFTAEIAIRRATAELPITVYRPSVVVGRSDTGELGPVDGPHHLIPLLANAGPARLPLSFPDRPNAPFNVVPADYVAEAIYELSLDPACAGRTYHLVDPAPIPTREALEMIGEQTTSSRRPGLGRDTLSMRLLGRLARSGGDYLHEFDAFTFFNPSSTLHALGGRVLCPPFHAIVGALVRYRPSPEARRAG